MNYTIFIQTVTTVEITVEHDIEMPGAVKSLSTAFIAKEIKELMVQENWDGGNVYFKDEYIYFRTHAEDTVRISEAV